MANFASKVDAVRHLERLWAGRPEAAYGVRIVNFIAEHASSKYLPMNWFLELGDRKDDRTISRVIAYLTGAEMHFLNLNLEFIDEDHARFLDADEASAATVNKINPLTGEPDPEIESKLFIYFSPTDSALEILTR